jgi:surfeit locus 1 family protein
MSGKVSAAPVAGPGARTVGQRRWLGPVLLTLVVAGAVVMTGLGVWQLQRLVERRTLNTRITALMAQPPVPLNGAVGDVPEYTPVLATGVYDFANEIVLRNRAHEQQPGVHVLTPLRLTDGAQAVLVDRGWIPYTQADPAVRAAFDGPAGVVTVTGLARRSESRSFFLLPADPTASPAAPRLDAWYWIDIPQIQGQVPYPILPFFVEAGPRAGPATLPLSSYEDIDLSDGPHLSYAIQWFAFALILVGGSLVLWRQNRQRGKEVSAKTT